MAVMGNDNVVVGNSSKLGQTSVEGSAASDRPCGLQADRQASVRTDRPKICGAMSQQRDHSGYESVPQKFVRLVGCHDPKAKAEPWVRPHLTPVS
jgi:hypothetical protein